MRLTLKSESAAEDVIIQRVGWTSEMEKFRQLIYSCKYKNNLVVLMYMSYLRLIVLVYACICMPCMFIDLPIYRRTTTVTIRPGLGAVTSIPIQSSNFFLAE